ncbi:MAG TPA: phage holin family protein [Candidatus Tidjanibacter faecipullorum]|uniref:Phage holin family protein n=1 Tax=Candidatus Tidjanibacter faecipullorum TaxID=2838766 RepID=A0A9D2DDQ1_9BACT|nr:phage holin family protein [Candidatus Tidjanibacter faecipullorum]
MREFLLKLGLAIVAYFSPLYEMYVVLMFFVAADLITGIIASERRGIPRSSRRLRKSITKLVAYLLAMTLSFSAEHAFKVEWFVAHRAIGALICAVEMLSILENMAVITGHPVFLKIIKWIRGKASDKNNVIYEIISEKNAVVDPASGAPDRMRRRSYNDGVDRPTADR